MSTSRDARAAARQNRQDNLQPPQHGLGRADRIRSRSVSPSTPGTFQFPPLPSSPKRSAEEIEGEQFRDALAFTDNMSTLSVDDIVRIATASAQAAAREFAAATPNPTATETSSSSNNIKKVELPQFDKKNIHTWIRRVEAAFGRAGVILPKDKFFFIEAKLDVNLNPKINEYLCGPSTEAKWDEFLNYLQEEYGRSKEQQASLFLSGIPRDGLRPTQHLAKIKDLTKDITLDDLIKEMVLKDLPRSVQQTLAERPNLSSEEAAKAADNYFDKEGRPKHETEPTRINNVDNNPEPEEADDDNGQVNAIPRGKFRGGHGNWSGNRQSRPQQQQQRNRYPAPSFPSQQRGGFNRNAPQAKPSMKQVCRFHCNYGEKAVYCEPGCQFKAKSQAKDHSGNGAAGRRM